MRSENLVVMGLLLRGVAWLCSFLCGEILEWVSFDDREILRGVSCLKQFRILVSDGIA